MLSAQSHPPGLPYRLDLTFRRNTASTYYATEDEAVDAGVDTFHGNDACQAWLVSVSANGQWTEITGEESFGDG